VPRQPLFLLKIKMTILDNSFTLFLSLSPFLSLYFSLSLFISFYLSLFLSLSLSLTGEEGVHTLFTGQRKRDRERGRERKRERETKRDGE
jgi:hypothetical protein